MKKFSEGKMRRARNYINATTKNVIFFVNFFFWLMGITLIIIGVWIRLDKSTEIRNLLREVIDPAVVVIMIGGVVFILGFLGCIGALRENLSILNVYYYGLTGALAIQYILITTVTVAYAVPSFRKRVSYFNPSKPLRLSIIKYHEDDDLRNLIDAVQRKFKCCGYSYSGEGYKDWGQNVYFNCTDDNKSVSRCGVPFSCCKPTKAEHVNVMCGYDVVGLDAMLVSEKIYTDGCLRQFGYWIKNHLVIVACVMAVLFIPQALAIKLTQTLQHQIRKQMHQWH